MNDWVDFWNKWDDDLEHQETLRDDLARSIHDPNYSESLFEQSITTARRGTLEQSEEKTSQIQDFQKYFCRAVIQNYKRMRMRGLYGERTVKEHELEHIANQPGSASLEALERVESKWQHNTIRESLTELSAAIERGKKTYDPWGVFLMHVLQKISGRIFEDLASEDTLTTRVERFLPMTEREQHIEIQPTYEILQHLWHRFAQHAEQTDAPSREMLLHAIRQKSDQAMTRDKWEKWAQRSRQTVMHAAKTNNDLYTRLVDVLWKGGAGR